MTGALTEKVHPDTETAEWEHWHAGLSDLANIPLGVYDKLLAARSLEDFIEIFWPYIDPSPFKPNWHIGAICAHLEAITHGDIKRLVITVPPRHMKSIAVSVGWPVWSWIDRPGLQFLFSSYGQGLSIRDAVKSRRLLKCKQFQQWWGDRFELTSDQNAKQRYENDQGGYRIATSVDGALTGDGGDILVVDDPHNVREGESEQKRKTTLEWWDEAMSTRLNDPVTGAKVIIQQRVHEQDLVGHVLEKEGQNWTHLNLPAEFEKDHRCTTSIGWSDPRTEEGELLWPSRFPRKELEGLKVELGSYGTAAQLQQRPSPREGGMFPVDKLSYVDHIPPGKHEVVRYWDKAGTEGAKNKQAAHTAGVKMYRLQDGRYLIANVTRGQWGSLKRETMIKATAEEDGVGVAVWVEQEPGSGGKESAENTVRALAGYNCRAERPVGDKVYRADPFAAQVEAGNVVLLRGAWNDAFVKELQQFPMSKWKDQVDGASGAFAKLTNVKRAGVVI